MVAEPAPIVIMELSSHSIRDVCGGESMIDHLQSSIRGAVGHLVILALVLAVSPVLSADNLSPGHRQPVMERLPADIHAELEAYAVQIMAEEGVPGMAYAIVEGDQVVYARGFGVREQHGDDPVNAHTLFQIGSNTKSFTTALVAMLVDEGRLAWTDPVTSHLQGFQLMDPWVTHEFMVEDLFSQRSGMPAYALDFMSFIGYDGQAIQRAMRYVEPVYSARSRMTYVNNLFLTGADLITQVSGFSWADNLDRRIFGPLGMAMSTTDPNTALRTGNLAREHLPMDDGSLWTIPLDWPYCGWLQTYAPAGGIYSNAVDMAQWIRAQLGNVTIDGRLFISAANLDYLHTPKTPAGIVSGDMITYCLAWFYQSYSPHAIVWHGGDTIGNHSRISLIPDAGIGIVVLTNSEFNKVPERLSRRYFDLYFGNPTPPDVSTGPSLEPVELPAGWNLTARRPPFPPAPKDKGPSLPPEAYVGRYRNPAYGVFEVVVQDDELQCLVGPRPFTARLEPYSGNTFRFSLVDYESYVCLATFRVPSDGPATELVVDFCVDADGGVFRRIEE
jgi:CubicO group peptidase (beta-lactamase class C family)